jgi:hypothetical protein
MSGSPQRRAHGELEIVPALRELMGRIFDDLLIGKI